MLELSKHFSWIADKERQEEGIFFLACIFDMLFIFFLVFAILLGTSSSSTGDGKRLDAVYLNATVPTFVTPTVLTDGNVRKTVTIKAAIPYGGDAYPVGPILTKAMEIALDHLHAKTTWPKHYQLNIEIIDTQV